MRVAIDIAPLVDVVFLLVIFFSVSTTFLEQSGIRLELPTSSSTADREVQELAVVVSKEGAIEFDGRSYDLSGLSQVLRAELEGRDRKIVVLRADTGTPHGEVVRVMDVVRAAGAEALTVATRSGAD